MSVYDSSQDALVAILNELERNNELLKELMDTKTETHGVTHEANTESGGWLRRADGSIICGSKRAMLALAENMNDSSRPKRMYVAKELPE